MKHLFLKSLILVALLTLLVVGVAMAAYSTTTGSVGGVPFEGEVGVSVTNPYDWQAYVDATADSSISVVGWYWWTTRELCGSTITYQLGHGGNQDTGYPIVRCYQSYIDTYHSSCSDHRLSSYAKFDFKNGSDIKSPILDSKTAHYDP